MDGPNPCPTLCHSVKHKRSNTALTETLEKNNNNNNKRLTDAEGGWISDLAAQLASVSFLLLQHETSWTELRGDSLSIRYIYWYDVVFKLNKSVDYYMTLATSHAHRVTYRITGVTFCSSQIRARSYKVSIHSFHCRCTLPLTGLRACPSRYM